mmetsp:Transcript_16312/g.24043  ORF Transcript_16312/g.24043 Transcript_16312/m.24043 type:complete len:86 (+) Transcript_16312:853-1110(+)
MRCTSKNRERSRHSKRDGDKELFRRMPVRNADIVNFGDRVMANITPNEICLMELQMYDGIMRLAPCTQCIILFVGWYVGLLCVVS